MKILKIVYSLITIFCICYGIPLTFINVGKEMFFPYLIVALVGIVLLLLGGAYIYFFKKANNKKE